MGFLLMFGRRTWSTGVPYFAARFAGETREVKPEKLTTVVRKLLWAARRPNIAPASGLDTFDLYVASHDGFPPMIPADSTALDLAVRRLERAVSQLEQRIAAKAAEAERALVAAKAASASTPAVGSAPGLFEDLERARLLADLDAAREREKALEEAGEQASVALGRAIAEIRAALGDERVANDLHAPSDDDDLFEDSEEA
jgi:hypothetical protein